MNWKRGYRKDKGRDNTGRWLKRHRETRTCRGSVPLGPSEDYQALLRGEIEADEYVRRMKADVDSRLSRASQRSVLSALQGPSVGVGEGGYG